MKLTSSATNGLTLHTGNGPRTPPLWLRNGQNNSTAPNVLALVRILCIHHMSMTHAYTSTPPVGIKGYHGYPGILSISKKLHGSPPRSLGQPTTSIIDKDHYDLHRTG